MKIVYLAVAALIMQPAFALAQDLDLSGYQKPEGAITAGYQGTNVDPYFATKALLVAKDGGLKMNKQALEWIDWAIHMQCADGSFERYERDSNNVWHGYADTDADDAMSALWLELLYRTAPESGLPQTWQESADKTEAVLAKLYDKNQGIYLISASNRVGLLMDNVEIYSSFKRIAKEQRRLGEDDKARAYDTKAARLSKNILKVFKPENGTTFAISTQARTENDFYPDKVAQLFPVLYRLPGNDNPGVYHQWIAANTKEWMDQRNDDYPWGLVAVAALAMDDMDTASCWKNRAEPMRYSKHWNVLEEVALQQVTWRMNKAHDTKIPCVGIEL